MRRLLCALASLAFGAAHAEEAAAPAPSPAQTIIAAAGAEGVFAAVDQASARHLGSGLLCRFQSDGQGGRIVLIPGLARGDDVACEFADAGLVIRLYATRLPVRASLDELAAASEESVRRAIPQAAPDGAAQLSPASAITPAWRARRFLIANENGARETLLLYVAQQGPWAFKLRYRAPAPDEESVRRASERAELMWRGALADAQR